MSSKTNFLPEAVHAYLVAHSVHEVEAQRALREETAKLPMAGMQISPEQGQFLGWLLRLVGARQVIEIGTFTGYSALCMALALPEGGRIVCCDRKREWTAVGERYWREAGVADRIDLRIGPALDTVLGLVAEGAAGRFDLAFIDADKTGYADYYERCLILLRPGGIIAIDNTLWSGSVADPGIDTDDTKALRALNAKIHSDGRVDAVMLPIGDGLTLARKKH
jgi:predicted O-methyltransferase YrrM